MNKYRREKALGSLGALTRAKVTEPVSNQKVRPQHRSGMVNDRLRFVPPPFTRCAAAVPEFTKLALEPRADSGSVGQARSGDGHRLPFSAGLDVIGPPL